jgi:hypothetical protein
VKLVYKTAIESAQIVSKDTADSDIVAPAFDFDALTRLYYANTYHRRAISLKASLLANIVEAKSLEGKVNNPRKFLRYFALMSEIYGSAFVEKAGSDRAPFYYNLPTHEARVDRDRNIYQIANGEKRSLEGFYYAQDSITSRFYGEPDYLGAIAAIAAQQKIDAFNNAFFDNGARADKAIIFENSEPSEEQTKAFADFFGANYRGVRNAHKTLVLSSVGENSKIRIEDLSRVDDLSFEKLKTITRDEIIAAHGVPPRMLGVMSAAQLGGGGEVAGQLQVFNELTIKPKQEEIAYFFESVGLPITLSPIDVSHFKDDASLAGELISRGIISVAEARAMLNFAERKE